MRAKFLLIPTISVLGLSLALFSSKALADDVVIDLSVLDSLGSSNSPVINAGPLFPTVSSSGPKFPEVEKSAGKKKAKAVKKAVKKKPAPQKISIPEKKDIKVEVKVKEEIVPAAAEETMPQPLPDEKYADSPFGVVYDEPVKVETVSAPVAPIAVQTEELPPVDEHVTMEPINGMTEFPKADRENEAKKEDVPVMPEASAGADASRPTVGESLLKGDDASSSAAVETSPSESSPADFVAVDSSAPTPLVDISTPAADISPALPSGGNEIVFDDDSYELDENDKQQIDEIIASFEDAKNNKIAIYAFNLDNGEDVFRKKRLSLNRAIEVRSYLLGRGYKNFSIKVVNITEDNGKSSRVVIEELK